MSKRTRTLRFDLDSLVLDAGVREPLHRQLRDQIRRAILEGRLRPGQRVPSTRGLAGSLGVGRNTVASAYDQLTSEGYLVPSVGSGTRVSPTLPECLLNAPRPGPTPAPAVGAIGLSRLSARGRQITAFGRLRGHDGGRSAPSGPPRRLSMEAASRGGVEYHPISRYSAAPPSTPGLILGYAAYPPESSRRAMQAWARALGGT